VMKQGTPAWSDNASITKQGGAKKLDAVYKFIDYELSIPWQARFVAASGNDGTISHAQATSKQAKAAGLTPSKLAVTLIPQTRDPKFFPSLVFYQSTNVLKQELDIWNDFKLGIH
jgi:spermidine/putrescine-binding protein